MEPRQKNTKAAFEHVEELKKLREYAENTSKTAEERMEKERVQEMFEFDIRLRDLIKREAESSRTFLVLPQIPVLGAAYTFSQRFPELCQQYEKAGFRVDRDCYNQRRQTIDVIRWDAEEDVSPFEE